MTDDHLIGNVLQLQTRRLTELRNRVDELTAQVKANGDSIDRLRTHMKENRDG